MTSIRLALDENVSHPLAAYLRSMGYDADSAADLGRLKLRDPHVLAAAVDGGQTLVTHNGKDFALLHEAWHLMRQRWAREAEAQAGVRVAFSGHHGILVLPQVANAVLAPAIVDILDDGQRLPDRLFVWSRQDGWVEPTF